MENISKLKELLSTPHTITLTTHRNPDGDAMGSMLAVYHFLKRQNHRVFMIAPSEYPENFEWMMGIQEMQRGAGESGVLSGFEGRVQGRRSRPCRPRKTYIFTYIF